MLTTALAALAAGGATRLLWDPVLTALPEPSGADADTKTPYRDLRGARPAWVAAALVALSCSALLLVPGPARPVWVGLATVGVLLALVDARTTWLPLRLTHALWLATALGVAALPFTAGPRATVDALVAAGTTGAFFWLFWRLTGGLGFGDVRLAPVLGAAAGAVSPSHAFTAVLLGTLLGAVVGVLRAAIGRRGPFPYGPALLAGPWLAVVALSLGR
ncbi:prepilin peptidase [Mariniluteicoccus flavus]